MFQEFWGNVQEVALKVWGVTWLRYLAAFVAGLAVAQLVG